MLQRVFHGGDVAFGGAGLPCLPDELLSGRGVCAKQAESAWEGRMETLKSCLPFSAVAAQASLSFPPALLLPSRGPFKLLKLTEIYPVMVLPALSTSDPGSEIFLMFSSTRTPDIDMTLTKMPSK